VSFNKADVLRNWDREGLDVVEDLAQRWGYERLPDPVEGDRLEDYLARCAREGLVHIAGNMQDQRAVRARMVAEEQDIPIYQQLDDAAQLAEAEAEFLDERAAELRATDPAARFAAYKQNRSAILNPEITLAEPDEEE